jgi:hypothetical protein
MTTFDQISKYKQQQAEAKVLADAEAKAQAKAERIERLKELINQEEDQEEDQEDRPIIEGGTELQQLLNSTQVQLAKLVFKPSVLNAWKKTGGGHGLKIREIWELTSPKTQCRNTIGSITDTTECWICGLRAVVNSPECEHILPIAQAVLMLGLYNPTYKNDTEDLKKEYAWAHKTCNQIKSDMVLIKESDESPNKCEVAQGRVEELLRSIFNNTRSYGQDLKKELKKQYNNKVSNFIGARLPAMTTKLTPIVDTINSRFSSGGAGLTLLSSMIAAASEVHQNLLSSAASVDTAKSAESISDEVADILNGLKNDDGGDTDKSAERISDKVAADILNGLKNHKGADSQSSAKRQRRGGTRRRTDLLFSKLHRSTPRFHRSHLSHHSIKMSSIRHSLSGIAARR